MKKNVFCMLLCSIFLLTGCSKDNEGNTPPLFSAHLYIYLDNFSEDVVVKADKGAVDKVEYNKEKSYILVDFFDPESTSQRKGTKAHEYLLTLTSNTVLSEYPEGYQLKLVSNEVWTEVSKIYDKDGKEIPFTFNSTRGIEIKIAN